MVIFKIIFLRVVMEQKWQSSWNFLDKLTSKFLLNIFNLHGLFGYAVQKIREKFLREWKRNIFEGNMRKILGKIWGNPKTFGGFLRGGGVYSKPFWNGFIFFCSTFNQTQWIQLTNLKVCHPRRPANFDISKNFRS